MKIKIVSFAKFVTLFCSTLCFSYSSFSFAQVTDQQRVVIRYVETSTNPLEPENILQILTRDSNYGGPYYIPRRLITLVSSLEDEKDLAGFVAYPHPDDVSDSLFKTTEARLDTTFNNGFRERSEDFIIELGILKKLAGEEYTLIWTAYENSGELAQSTATTVWDGGSAYFRHPEDPSVGFVNHYPFNKIMSTPGVQEIDYRNSSLRGQILLAVPSKSAEKVLSLLQEAGHPLNITRTLERKQVSLLVRRLNRIYKQLVTCESTLASSFKK